MSDNNSSIFACRLHPSRPSAIRGERVTRSPALVQLPPRRTRAGVQKNSSLWSCKFRAGNGRNKMGEEQRKGKWSLAKACSCLDQQDLRDAHFLWVEGSAHSCSWWLPRLVLMGKASKWCTLGAFWNQGLFQVSAKQ